MEKVIQVNLASQLDLILFQLHDGVGVLRLGPAAPRSPLGPSNPCELDLLPSQGSNKLSLSIKSFTRTLKKKSHTDSCPAGREALPDEHPPFIKTRPFLE